MLKNTNTEKLRHGQAMTMQWIGYLLQVVSEDISQGGVLTNKILGGAKSVGGSTPENNLVIGCTWVSNTLLSFATELALKAMLIKEKKNHPYTHTYWSCIKPFQ